MTIILVKAFILFFLSSMAWKPFIECINDKRHGWASVFFLFIMAINIAFITAES